MANGQNQLQRTPQFPVAPQAGGMVRHELGATQMTVHAETHHLAGAAKAEALVKAKIAAAIARPRDIDVVRSKLLQECRRPEFADSAIYSKPVGGKSQEGLSIRFAEAAIRAMGNIDTSVSTSSEDPFTRRLTVDVMDLESLVNYGREITLQKTVERKSPKEGAQIVSERVNSYGQTTYTVIATEDELLGKESALVSKTLRTAALRLLPGDIQDECRKECEKTLADRGAKDPGAEKKRVIDAFAAVGVDARQLKAYLSKQSLDVLLPAELKELRSLLNALKQGETTWSEAYEAKTGRAEGEVEAPPEESASAPTNAPTDAELVQDELPKSAEASAENGDVTPSDPVDNFLFRLEHSFDDEVSALVHEAGTRRADWGDRANEVGAAVSARRKRKNGNQGTTK